MGVKGAESLTKGMDSPLIESLNISFFKHLLVTLMTLLPSSIEGLMGLWEEQAVSPSFRGLDVIWMKVPPFKWEWFSEPLDCPPNEGCSPEPMVGTMNPLGGNPRPSRAGRKSEREEQLLLSKRRYINYSRLGNTRHDNEGS